MRDSNYKSVSNNKAAVTITTSLYDRRALDVTSDKPLVNSLNHLTYLVSSLAKVRETLSVDGGIERLIEILHECHNLTFNLNDNIFNSEKKLLTAWKWTLAFQCLVLIGTRGTEKIRQGLVKAGILPIIATVLDNYLTLHERTFIHANSRQSVTSNDPLLTVSAFVRKTIPTGISNDVMGSVPRHPFFLKVLDSLKPYKKNWLVPYVTIMYTTGPLFLSVIWKQYKRWGVPEAGKVRILLPEDYKTHKYSFFAIAPGSSWHLDDAKFVKSLANHIGLAVFGGFVIAGIFFFLEYLLYLLVISNGFKKLMKKFTSLFTPLNKYMPLNSRSKTLKKRARKDSNLPAEVDFDNDKAMV